MKTELIFGPPGTGKTTVLLKKVDECLEKNIAPWKIGFISFTRKSIDEAVERAAKKYNKKRDWFTYFRTIHSLSFRQLGLAMDEVMKIKDYRAIGEKINTNITGYTNSDGDIYELQIGDQMVSMESLARMCMKEYKDIYNSVAPNFSWEQFELYINTLNLYKEKNYLIDFTDMLENFLNRGSIPDIDILFVDEAQDLCKLQWKIVNKLCTSIKEVYIAGDDDQAIFRWSGADVDYFIDLSRKYSTVVLNKSYRLPNKVHKLATEISGRMHTRVNKSFYSTDEEGSIEYVQNFDDIDLSEGKFLILIRNGYMEKEVIASLRMQGFTYTGRRDNPSKYDSLLAALTWEKLRKGEGVSRSSIEAMMLFIKGINQKVLQGINKNEIIDPEKFTKLTGLSTNRIWHDVLNKISIEDREYFIAARKRGETFTGMPRIKVSTIHGAKGSECENVVLFTDISRKTHSCMTDNYDDEARVFYTGITRAKEKLYIVMPQTRYYFEI